MKRLIQLLAIVSVVGVMALLSGCEKENLGGKRAFKEVVFGAKAHSSTDTRTQYMDYDGTAAFQNIRWLASDRIRIYSPNAARRVAVDAGEESDENPYYYWAEYQVVPNSSDPTTGTLKNMNTDGNSMSPQNPGYNPGTTAEDSSSVSNGLVWLNGESATFYGAYPSKALRGNKDGSGSSVADGKFNFAIPNVQPFSVKGNMDYAFMTAKTYAKDGQNVTLEFFPDFTAFEISLKCEESGSDVKLKSFKLGTTANGNSGNLAGSYIVDLSGTKSYTLPVDASSYGKSITVNTSSDPKSIPSGDADSLVFTVFALPDDLSNLYVEFTTSTGGEDNRTWKLDLSKKDANDVFKPITFGACKKHRIYGLMLPTGWNFKYITLEGQVIEWEDKVVSGLDTDNLPEASQFVVNGANNGRYYTSGDQTSPVSGRDAKAYRQYWLMKSGVPTTVTFKIMAPEGGTYKVVPQGDTSKFTIAGSLTGSIAAKPASSDTPSETTVVKLTITSTTTDADAVLYFKTYVTDKNGNQYSLDSETQLFDLRGYHYFVMNNSTTVQ